MSISAESLRRILALNLVPEVLTEVLAILAECQEDDNPQEERSRTLNAARQARYRERRQTPAVDWNVMREQVFARDNYTCTYCGAKTDKPHCDHVVPVSRGGASDLANLTTACPPCNFGKSGKTLDEWRHG